MHHERIDGSFRRAAVWPQPTRSRLDHRELPRPAVVLPPLLALLALFSGCAGSSSRSSPGATSVAGSSDRTDHGPIIARAGASPIAADEIPACFVEGEPPQPGVAERTDVFQPSPRTATPAAGAGATATARPTPELARIATQASFPLYAFNAPGNELTPQLMRVTSAAGSPARQVTLFALQYRSATSRGSVVIVLSNPPTASGLTPNDVDDAIDAIRLEARLPGTPRSGDPLVDPGAALRGTGCPRHEQLNVLLEGIEYPAVLVTWPGLSRVQILHIETGHGELSLETGAVDRAGLLALPQRLVSLQRSPAVVEGLQSYFGAGILPGLSTPHSSLPPTSRTPTPAGGR